MANRFPFLEHDGVLAFAHRGGTGTWPENTMPAFQHAVDLGYRYLETDVHLSADGILYAFHDDNLLKRTGVNAYIADLTAAEIDALLVDGVARIPRLTEILSTWPMAHLNIDTKSDASVVPLIELIRAYNAIDRICVGSFVDRRVKLCRRELGPDLCTSMGQREVLRLIFASWGLADPKQLQAACAQIPLTYGLPVTTPAVIRTAHEHGIQVHIWTIDETDEMNRLLDMGVDGIMTDQPLVLRQALIDREEWAPGGQSRADLIASDTTDPQLPDETTDTHEPSEMAL